MTRSHKLNDRDHVALADGSAPAEEHLPRYFAKSGHVDADPKKVKKEGGGKGNWYVLPFLQSLPLASTVAHRFIRRGRSGDEMQDYGYNFTNTRRRSNSSTHGHAIGDFKTKFEAADPEPVFEEQIHGAPADDETDEHTELHKEETADSTSGASVEEEEHAKKV